MRTRLVILRPKYGKKPDPYILFGIHLLLEAIKIQIRPYKRAPSLDAGVYEWIKGLANPEC